MATIDKKVIFKPTEETEEEKQINDFKYFASKLLEMDNLLVLAGSGTSLSFNPESTNEWIAPSMWHLWEECKNIDKFQEIIEKVCYDRVQTKKDASGSPKEDIELLLSLVDQSILLGSSTDKAMLEEFKQKVIDQIFNSTNFVVNKQAELEDKWLSHNQFINKLGVRKLKQSRLKIFTTNYDMAFEQAASNQGFVTIDGFDFGQPQRFNPMWYEYDIVYRSDKQGQNGTYLENVLQLYKLHGSCDWRRIKNEVVKTSSTTDKGDKVIIYPSSNKYKSSYDSPYLDMISSFTQALKLSNTALICVGYGFNDEHLNNAITMALRTNTSLHLLVVSPSMFSKDVEEHSSFKMLYQLITQNNSKRIGLLEAKFDDFVNFIPAHGNKNPDVESLKAQLMTLINGVNHA